MYQVLLFSVVAALGLALTTVAIVRGTLRPVVRIVLGLVFGAATMVALVFSYGTFSAIRDNNAHSLPETVVAQLRTCAARPDSASILAALQAAGFAAELTPHPYPSEYNSVWLPPWAVAQSTSYISLMTDRVRSDSLLTADRLAVVFLFDAQGRLLTWTYDLYSISM